MKEILGSPPVLVALGQYAHIDSSIALTFAPFINHNLISLNFFTAPENRYHGSMSLTEASWKMKGKKSRNWQKRYSRMKRSKLGRGIIDCQSPLFFSPCCSAIDFTLSLHILEHQQ